MRYRSKSVDDSALTTTKKRHGSTADHQPKRRLLSMLAPLGRKGLRSLGPCFHGDSTNGEASKITLVDLPQELLEMIIARMPFHRRTLLNLRSVCQKLSQIISVDKAQCLLKKIVVNSFPYTHNTLPTMTECSLLELTTVESQNITANAIIDKVCGNMLGYEHLAESDDWPDIMLKGLIVWQRFCSSCLQKDVGPRTILADNECLSTLSVETHLLLRYVAVKLQRCLDTILLGARFTHLGIGDNDHDWLRHLGTLVTAFGLMRPELEDMRLIITQAELRAFRNHPAREEPDAPFGIALQTLERHAEHLESLPIFLARNHDWDPTVDALIPWLCQHPANATAFTQDGHPHPRGLAHYKTLQTLVAKMLEVENITKGEEYLTFAGQSLDNRSAGLSTAMVQWYYRYVEVNQTIHPQQLLNLLTGFLDPVQVVDANLICAESKLRKSIIANSDQVFDKAVVEMNLLDGLLRDGGNLMGVVRRIE